MFRMYGKYRMMKNVSKSVTKDLASLIIFLSSLTVALATLSAKAIFYTCKIVKYGVLNLYTITTAYEE